MRKATIITNFGKLEFEYETTEDLEPYLKEIILDAKIIETSAIDIIKRELRKVKPGMEGIYQFTPSGKVELLFYPQTLVAKCILVLYAYHPQTVRAEELEDVTGIISINSKVLGQTKNKQYFKKDQDYFGLTTEGINYFEDNIKSQLLKPVPISQEEE